MISVRGLRSTQKKKTHTHKHPAPVPARGAQPAKKANAHNSTTLSRLLASSHAPTSAESATSFSCTARPPKPKPRNTLSSNLRVGLSSSCRSSPRNRKTKNKQRGRDKQNTETKTTHKKSQARNTISFRGLRTTQKQRHTRTNTQHLSPLAGRSLPKKSKRTQQHNTFPTPRFFPRPHLSRTSGLVLLHRASTQAQAQKHFKQQSQGRALFFLSLFPSEPQKKINKGGETNRTQTLNPHTKEAKPATRSPPKASAARKKKGHTRTNTRHLSPVAGRSLPKKKANKHNSTTLSRLLASSHAPTSAEPAALFTCTARPPKPKTQVQTRNDHTQNLPTSFHASSRPASACPPPTARSNQNTPPPPPAHLGVLLSKLFVLTKKKEEGSTNIATRNPKTHAFFLFLASTGTT